MDATDDTVDPDETEAHEDGHAGHGGSDGGNQRTTAPMSEFTAREAGVGAAVTLVGLFVAFVLPFVLA